MADYLTQATLAEDSLLLARIAACAFEEGLARPPAADPREWARAQARAFATQPGWDEAVLRANGNIQAGVTDEMIRVAAHNITASQPPAASPEEPTSPAE